MTDILRHVIADAPGPVAPYSHAVEAGGFVFVTGQLATGPDPAAPLPDGIEVQSRRVFENLATVLGHVGLAFSDVVMLRIYLTDFDAQYPVFNAVYAEHFPSGALPARTTVGVTRLARGGLVEVDLVARRPPVASS